MSGPEIHRLMEVSGMFDNLHILPIFTLYSMQYSCNIKMVQFCGTLYLFCGISYVGAIAVCELLSALYY